MGTSTLRRAGWGITLGLLLALPVLATSPTPATIVHGVDIFSTSAGTQVDFSSSPLPAGFFCTGSAAFSGVIPFTGVPLTTVPAGIAGSTDTVVERLADGVFSTSGTATIPVVIRALQLRSASNLTVFCPAVGNTSWRVDVCLCGLQPNTTITASIDPECGTCGVFDGKLQVNACLRFVRLDTGATAGPVSKPITLVIDKMPWCYKAGLHETVITRPFSVDTNCDGHPDLTLPATTNFHPGWSCSTVGLDCWALFASLTHCHDGPSPGHPHCVNPVCGQD
jgi:hypothetical protein